MVMTSSALGYDTPPLPVQEPEVEAAQAAVDEAETTLADEKMTFSIQDIQDNEDGGIDMTISMDYNTMVIFAKIGLGKAISDALVKTVEEHGPY